MNALTVTAPVSGITSGDVVVCLLLGMAAIAVFPVVDVFLGWLAGGSDASEEVGR